MKFSNKLRNYLFIAILSNSLFIGQALTNEPIKKLNVTGQNHPQLIIGGDSESTYPNGKPADFRGFSDPCIRQDPITGKLWMAYSWPHMEHLGRGPRNYAVGVESHLAKSDDKGKSWEFVKVLWPRTPARYSHRWTRRLRLGYISHEVPNILPVEVNGKLFWVGARADYFLPRFGNYKRRDNRSFCIRLFRAKTPEDLTSASPVTFGHTMSTKECNVDVNVCEFSEDFPANYLPTEPALHYSGGRLYLAFVALLFYGKQPLFDKSFIAVFSTVPKGEISSWKWQYDGKLATNKDASELGGQALSQIELARDRKGKLLAFVTPLIWDAKLHAMSGSKDAFFGFVHHGCHIVEVSSLAKPALARGADGKLVRRAFLYSSEEANHGPGAPGYDAASKSGVILTLRQISTVRSLSWYLHQTELHP